MIIAWGKSNIVKRKNLSRGATKMHLLLCYGKLSSINENPSNNLPFSPPPRPLLVLILPGLGRCLTQLQLLPRPHSGPRCWSHFRDGRGPQSEPLRRPRRKPAGWLGPSSTGIGPKKGVREIWSWYSFSRQFDSSHSSSPAFHLLKLVQEVQLIKMNRFTRDYPGLLRQSLKFCETTSSHPEICSFQAP